MEPLIKEEESKCNTYGEIEDFAQGKISYIVS